MHRPHSFTKARNEFIASRSQTKELVEGFNLANVTNLFFARQTAQRQNFRRAPPVVGCTFHTTRHVQTD